MLAFVIFIQPSVTLNVTVKLLLLFVNWLWARPICVVPASVLVADAVPLNVKSLCLYLLSLISTS